jgi:tetratricopeptide (TPR) repeat protein
MGEDVMIFLTTGEKVKSLRKKFNMRQQELEDENITRAFISMIENGKRGLSKETAKHISSKLSKKAEELGMNLNIDEAYLLRTPQEDAEVYCLEKLNNTPTSDEIEVIIGISQKYNLINVEAQAYKTLGDYEFDLGNSMNAFMNYILSLDLYKDTQDKKFLPYLYNRLGICKIKQLEYIEAISLLNRANHYSKLYGNKEIEKYSIYNLARIHKKLKKYDESLELIEKYLHLCSKAANYKEYIYAKVLKANCYNGKGSTEKAISIFMDMLEGVNGQEDESLWYAYNNLAAIYLEQNNLDKSLEYFEKAEKALENSEKRNLSYTYIQKAQVYIRQRKYDEALKLVSKGLKLTIEYNEIEGSLKAYYVLTDIYNELRDFQNLKATYIKLLDILKSKEYYKQEVNKVYNRLALLYLEQNDIEMCKKYLNMAS